MKARLIIEEGDALPESLELESTQAASLGRSRDNTVVLRSEHASPPRFTAPPRQNTAG